MAQNFPSNPIVGNSYTVNNESWTYDGSGWSRAVTATGSGILPPVADNSGRYLTTDGSTISWGTVAAAVPKITGISVTDNSYTVLDDTAVGTGGGYIKITGTGFTAGSQVLIGTVAASSVSFAGSTELRAQVPATVAGTYVVYVVAADGAVAIRVNGITFSSTPNWSTGSSLGTSGAAISIQLAAVSDTAITYSLAAGSTLPSGLSLSSSGLLSGTVTGVTVDITYNFTINAVDLENQDSPRTFSITITVKDVYFSYVPLLLETGSSSARSTVVTDSAQTPNTVTRVGNPSTGWVSPYQTDGYWGNYFNGSTSTYLTVPASNIINFGTGNFTVELWFYINPGATSNASWQRGQLLSVAEASVASGFSIVLNGTTIGGTGIQFNIVGAVGVQSTAAVSQGVWHHVAVSRSGSTAYLFLDGALLGTGTNSGNVGNVPLTIGAFKAIDPQYDDYFAGYISNLRIVKGVSVYTGAFTPPISPLQTTQSAGTNISAITGSQTSLLTCQSNRFIDNSNGVIAITVTGTPRVDPYFYPSGFTSPAASPGAALFNGSSQYLSATANAVFAFGTAAWTVEAWVYVTTLQDSQLFDTRTSVSTSGVGCRIAANGTLGYSGSANNSLTSTAITANSWNHVAWSYDGTTLSGYINGVRGGTATPSFNLSQNNAFISRVAFTPGEYIAGYISNLRVVKGVAVYSGASFTLPTTPLTATQSSNVNGNPSAAITGTQTSLLLGFADSNYTSATDGVQNNTFIDTGPYAFPITRNGTPTQGSITPYWPDGQWSNYFAGSQSISAPASSSFQFAGDFTIECWLFRTDTSGSSAYVQFNGSAYFAFNVQPGTGFDIYLNSPTPNLSVTDRVPARNVWNHIALVRSGSGSGNVKVYLNGVASATTATNTSTLGFNATAYVGALGTQSAGSTVGYISNFRIASSAVYTSNFTPPTTPLGAISGGQNPPTGTQTKLLTCQSNRFLDNSPVPFAITPNGTLQVQAFQPFSPTASYTTALYGGSGYFNGNGAYLTITNNANLRPGTLDFTLECWVYWSGTNSGNATNCNFLGSGWSGYSQTGQWIFYLDPSTGVVRFQVWSGLGVAATTALAQNRWYHIAVTRATNTFKLYLNGKLDATNTASLDASTTVWDFYIGVYYDPSGPTYYGYFPGYMSDLRLVLNTVVYNGDFTPPSGPLTQTGGSYPSTTNVNTNIPTANTRLLLNFTNAAIYDAAAQNNAITIGNAQVSTAQSKWSPTSMAFDGSGDYLNIPSSQGLNLGTGSLTVEAWVYLSAMSGDYFIVSSTGNGGGFFGFRSGTDIGYGRTGIAWDYQAASGMVINNWYHVAWSRNGTSMRIFVNGSQVGATQTTSQAYDLSTTSTAVGSAGATFFLNGYIQDLRITRGIGRYTANFTPPILAFQTR